MSLQQVIDTSGNALWVSPLTYLEASTPGTGGFIDTANQRLGIQHISPITTPESLGRVTLEGTKMQLGDVATVVEDHPPLIGDALTTTGPGLMFVIEKAPGASALDVTRQTETAIREMQPGLGGVTFNTSVFRPATYIEHGIGNLETTLVVCAILALLALTAFLLRWRAVVITLVTVPVSFVAAALVLQATGTTMNAVAFIGLLAALPLVIDDAVVSVEAIASRLGADRSESIARVISRASLEVRSASVYATLVLAVAVVPMYFLEQVPGAFFPAAASSYLLALLAALVVSITVTPALAVLLLTRTARSTGEAPLVRWLRRAHAASLPRAAARPLLVLVASLVVLAAGGAALASMHNSTPAVPQGEPGARAVGCRSGDFPARDGPPDCTRCERVAGAAGRDPDRGPRRQGRDCRSDRRRECGRAVGPPSAPTRTMARTLASIRDRDERLSRGSPAMSRRFSTEKVKENLTGAAGDAHRRPRVRRGTAGARAVGDQAGGGARQDRRCHARACGTPGPAARRSRSRRV